MNLIKPLFRVSGMTLISRLLGFIRDILIAATFGAGSIADAFFIALKFPNILEVADNAFQTLLESVKDHDKSLNDLSASNKAVHIWSFLHGITSISKKMDVALALPDSEMPIPVRSIKRARDNLRQFIEDLF